MGAEIISRRCLPHWYVPGAAHFVTYRLHGTLPRDVLDDLRQRRETLLQQKPPPGSTAGEQRARMHKQLFDIYDDALNRASGDQFLADPRLAAMVRSNLYHHHGGKYHLLAYCVMSNHVHVLFVPKEDQAVREQEVGKKEERMQPGRLHHVVQASGPDSVVQAARLQELPVGEQPDERSPLSKIMHSLKSLKSYTAHEANKLLRRSGTFWQAESYDHWVRDDDELERIVDYIAFNPVQAGLVKRPEEWFFSSSHDRFLREGDPSGWLRLDT